MAKSKKSSPAEPEMKPTMYLEGKAAQKMMGAPVGKKVRFMVEAEITSQSVRQSYMTPGAKHHSVGMEISRVKPVEKSKPASKRKK